MDKKILGIIAVSMIALLGVGMVAAFSFGNRIYDPNLSEEEKAEMQAFRENVNQAIEDKDFEAWKTIKESKLTEENFNMISEKHKIRSEMKEAIAEAKEAGDWARVQEIKEEYGFKGKGFGRLGIGGCPKLAE